MGARLLFLVIPALLVCSCGGTPLNRQEGQVGAREGDVFDERHREMFGTEEYGMEEGISASATEMPELRSVQEGVGPEGTPPSGETAAPSAGSQSARAVLTDAENREVGRAEFIPSEKGVRMELSLRGLAPGTYAVHVHENGECRPPDFSSAGDHFNPCGKQHGFLNPQGPHAGDLPNISVKADGTGEYEFTTGWLSLEPGAQTSLLRPGGTALVLHSGGDDYLTDPAGDSGDRVACGMIIGRE